MFIARTLSNLSCSQVKSPPPPPIPETLPPFALARVLLTISRHSRHPSKVYHIKHGGLGN
jgi:hypothetical protein